MCNTYLYTNVYKFKCIYTNIDGSTDADNAAYEAPDISSTIHYRYCRCRN